MKNKTIKLDVLPMLIMLFAGSICWYYLLQFCIQELSSTVWQNQNVIFRAFTKQGIGLFACCISAFFVLIFLIYDLIIIVKCKFGKTGIELTEDYIDIKYSILPTRIRWIDIENVEIITETIKNGYRNSSREFIQIKYDRSIYWSNYPEIIKKIFRLSRNYIKIPSSILFKSSVNEIFSRIDYYHSKYVNNKE